MKAFGTQLHERDKLRTDPTAVEGKDRHRHGKREQENGPATNNKH